jgi:hypothetical protein
VAPRKEELTKYNVETHLTDILNLRMTTPKFMSESKREISISMEGSMLFEVFLQV